MAPILRRSCTSLLIWEQPTFWIPAVGSVDLKGNTTVFTELLSDESRSVDSEPSGESRSVDSESIEDWRNDRLLQIIEGYDFCDIR
jgi:hypothetical protein